ncbi:Gfo/Idh/MocA family oxidoreductase [Vibrio tapetis subsp. quintayensis]|uniref:Gfo/Idh/MocA family protein n=1 Tax=Vibrio tapetis TaxID=52443 RepID=UPI0025B55C09|nr:Gfo/Idh/MocA family oxidoreductase [Vibrio tapetis]MDN3682937.1 Gfo/Idh/MocA family oxidoreductase [Vibrio tapetis subsp. quintayensis]
MIKLGIIGTNWITDSFIRAALATRQFELVSVYSRSLDKGQEFAKQYDADVTVFDDFEQFSQHSGTDAVYVASPNSLHCEQSIALLNAKKHVICEKPLGSNLDQVEAMYQAAQANKVVLFEAFKTPYLPNFEQLRSSLNDIAPLRKVLFNYCQYSSRYQKYLNGENPNTFNPAFSNGSIMDIGYYCVASAIELFGEPTSIYARADLLDSGVDGHGSVLMSYVGFDVMVAHSKVSNSSILSEVQGEQGAVSIEHLSEAKQVKLHLNGQPEQDLTVESDELSMRYEAEHFAKQINNGEMDENAVGRSLITARVITEIRKQTGVVFPADTSKAG